jgi:hypothetical protein
MDFRCYYQTTVDLCHRCMFSRNNNTHNSPYADWNLARGLYMSLFSDVYWAGIFARHLPIASPPLVCDDGQLFSFVEGQ